MWGCEFTPDKVRFFFDGKLTHETEATKFNHGPENIWLTCIATPLGGTKHIDDKQLPATAEFDYVRYFAPAGGRKYSCFQVITSKGHVTVN